LLEALYLFNNQALLDEQGDSDNMEPNNDAAEFITTATSQLKEIRSFVSSVPLAPLGAIVNHSADWAPAKPEIADDWFLKFKANWRKIFDRKWTAWLADQRKAGVHRQLATIFGLDEVPRLPNRPWSELWDDISFKFDYALGFLVFFFKNVFPQYTQILKIVMLEGRFYQNEQRQLFTDALDTLLQQEKNLDVLIEMLDGKGAYGALFSDLASSGFQSKQKVKALMEKIENEAGNIIVNFSGSCSSLVTVLDVLDGNTARAQSAPNVMFTNEKTQLLFTQKLTGVRENLSKITVLLKQIGDMSDSERELQEMALSA
jgi:hypothetical protein